MAENPKPKKLIFHKVLTIDEFNNISSQYDSSKFDILMFNRNIYYYEVLIFEK